MTAPEKLLLEGPGSTSSGTPSGLSGQLAGLVALDFVLGFALLWDRYPLPVVAQPTGIAVVGLLILLGALRRPTHQLRHRGLMVALFAVMMVAVIVVTQLNALDWVQRSTKMVLLFVFALTIAVGRVHLRSLLAGLTVGLLANVGLFYAGLTSNAYPPYLTGFLGDKNVAGLMYAVVLVAGLALYRRWQSQLVHVVVLAVPLVLTGSRTSMAAAVAGLVWVLLRNRLPLLWRFALVGTLIWLLGVVERQFARMGLFADRGETDWFREQIRIATELKVANAPWYGEGLTTAWVLLGGTRFMWFHDSYAAMRIEGGWIMIAIMGVLILVLGLGLLQPGRVGQPLLFAEGAIVVVLVCAWQLGEVFFTTPAFLVLGMAWRLRWGVPLESPQNLPGDLVPERSGVSVA
ncbi:zinc ABC transporter permease [Aestuariimicrobium sp. Y1814]|uniref:zinc ABC transporter permease n=1 Tax=Aestuariimicrobium sp. Y1814 TaxID=3418742 RepID=UPI003DA708FF